MRTTKETRIIIYSIIACAVISVMIFYAGGMFPGQPRVFMFSDLYYQYVHTINMFLRKLLGGQSLDYSFEMGLGMPTEAVYAGYCLSPFNVLFCLISDIDIASFVITIAKISMAAGMFSFASARMLKTGNLACVVFSLFYALGGYSVNFSSCIVFLDGLYMLPLIVYFIYEFIYKGSWKRLSVAYAYIFVVQIYSGYIVGVFSAVIFLAMLIIRFGSDRKRCISSIVRFAGCVLTASLLSAVVILPEISGILSYSQADKDSFTGLRSHLCGLLGAFFAGNTMGIYNIFPVVYSGLTAFMLIPLFFLRKDIERKYKIGVGATFGFLAICTLWGPAYLFMHVFNTPDGHAYRFSYFWTFVIAFVCLWCYVTIKDFQTYRKPIAFCSVIGCLLYGGLLLIQEHEPQENQVFSVLLWMINAFFLLSYGYLFGKKSESKAVRTILASVFMLEVFVNGYFITTGMKEDSLVRSKSYYDLWRDQAKGAVEVIRQKETEDPNAFYRVCYQNAPVDNISMLYGYRGLGYFSSIENVKLRNVMNRLGYATSPRFLLDYGSAPVMRMLLGQRYYVQVADPRGEQPEYYAVLEQAETLGLGYMVSDKLIDYDTFESTDPFENQNRLVSAMCGKRTDLYEKIDNPLYIQQEGVRVEMMENAVSLTRETEDTGYVRYSIRSDSDRPAYAYFSLFGMSAQDYSSPVIFSRIDRGCAFSQSYLTMPHILPLGMDENGGYLVSIAMSKEGMQSISYENQYFVCYNDSAKSEAYQYLKENEWELEQFTDAKISGHVEVPADKTLLFTTVPYDANWHIYVDGKEESVGSVLNGTFIAVPLQTGSHDVVLEYRNPWKYRGMMGTMAGICILVAFSVIERMRNKKKV